MKSARNDFRATCAAYGTQAEKDNLDEGQQIYDGSKICLEGAGGKAKSNGHRRNCVPTTLTSTIACAFKFSNCLREACGDKMTAHLYLGSDSQPSHHTIFLVLGRRCQVLVC